MKDFIYKIRKFLLHSKRRYRPGARNFWLNFRKDPIFRLIIILVFLLAVAIIAFILLLTIIPNNPIRDYFNDDQVKEVNYSNSPEGQTSTPEPSKENTVTPTITPDPNELTPTPLVTEEEKSTITGWITAQSGLIVRTGPSSQTAKLGTLPYGTEIEIIKEGTWHFIEYKDGGGYVHTNYVVVGEAPPGTSTKNTNTSQTWTHLDNSTKLLVEKIFYNGVTYYIADIKTESNNILSAYSFVAKTPTELLDNKSAIFAINGDYFGFRDEGIIIRNSKLLRDVPYPEIAVLYEDGRLDVYFDGEKDSAEMINEGAIHSWSFGPILVKDYIAYDDFSKRSDIGAVNPRTGIGMIEPNHYIFIVADGRQETSKGFTLAEFAQLFKEYKCETAYNLDGGGTSIMIFKDEIISSPSGGKERAISDVIYIR